MENHNQNKAITQCYMRGIAISNKKFSQLVKQYNNWEMPISKRVSLIAEDKEPKFYEFIKDKV